MDYCLQLKKSQHNFTIVVPFIRFQKELEQELLLNAVKSLYSSDYFTVIEKGSLNNSLAWAQNVLTNCRLIPFTNKNSVIKELQSQPLLGHYLETGINKKLGDSLKTQLRLLPQKRIKFQVPSSFNFKYYVWGILSEHFLFICDQPNSQFPLGWHEFIENKEFPPNRAYLKLWEVLSLGYIQLSLKDVVVELGASPGGWSWVLSQFVKKVYSIDKAPLAPQVQAIQNIEYSAADAFNVNLATFPEVNWLFSDIICTPQRLLSLVQKSIKETTIQNYVCTIKFKGSCDFEILKEFQDISNSRILHLYQNKNEVTWIRQIKK